MNKSYVLFLVLISGLFFRLFRIEERFDTGETTIEKLVSARVVIENQIPTYFEKFYRDLFLNFFSKTGGIETPWIAWALFSSSLAVGFYVLGKLLVNSAFGVCMALGWSWSFGAIEAASKLGIMYKDESLDLLEYMGSFLFGKGEVGYVLIAFFVTSLALMMKLGLLSKTSRGWRLFVMLFFANLVFGRAWFGFEVLSVFVLAWTLYFFVNMTQNKEVLFWIGFGFFGFWLIQNWDLLKIKNNLGEVKLAKQEVDKISPGKVRLQTFGKVENLAYPLLYLLQKENRLSNEGGAVLIYSGFDGNGITSGSDKFSDVAPLDPFSIWSKSIN